MRKNIKTCTTSVTHKPQISSIPGISPKIQNRYRVTLRSRILGDRLTIEQAIANRLGLIEGGEADV
ncbi:MAG TPA: hypothetical protein V6D37_14975 [Candidatus Sericytochromatia bacterium]|jgi:hypothetical protein